MPFENRIFLDLEISIPKGSNAKDAKHTIEGAIKRKLEEVPTDVYEDLRDDCHIIVFKSVRGKGGP